MSDEKELVMSFDPKTIEHLGIKMYSTLPPVLAELIANGYDADAENIKITLLDTNEQKEIIVEDDGLGMSFPELNDKFLRIGRPRRYEEGTQTTQKGRKIIGKKGIGKLSFFGITKEIEISTKKGGKENSFIMNWDDIKKEDNIYHPGILLRDNNYVGEGHGTKIVLKNIQRETDFTPNTLADNLSKIFIVDTNFKISIQHNSESPVTVENERKYTGLDKEVEWKVPEDITIESDYEKKNLITGHLIATKRPIPPKTNMKGITLFSRKKLVNQPSYFSDSTSSHGFSYLTGYLEIDFIDDMEEDVISTNRQSLNWNNSEMKKLNDYLSKLMNWLERDWRKKRAEVRERKITEITGINISDWYGNLPLEIKEKVKPLVDALVKDSESSDELTPAVRNLYSIAPKYIYWHYRHLHPEIQDSSKEKYENKDYYDAFLESAKHYINSTRLKSCSINREDRSMMGEVFGCNDGKLSVAKRYIRPNGTNFNTTTKENIEEGQKFLSMGVVAGGKNVVGHEEMIALRDSNLFTEMDCLDMLSLLSHLTKRLDDAELEEEQE
jgi:uncharacterized protein (TIGR02391 family)